MADTQKHLLIVDDETALRSAIAERLADQGFSVEQAGSGEEALQRLTEFAFDILITDLRLPGINGRELARRLLPLRPEMKVLYLSGYAGDSALRRDLSAEKAFLAKPFTPEALARKVREILDTPTPAAALSC